MVQTDDLFFYKFKATACIKKIKHPFVLCVQKKNLPFDFDKCLSKVNSYKHM